MSWRYSRPGERQLQYYANDCKVSKTSTAKTNVSPYICALLSVSKDVRKEVLALGPLKRTMTICGQHENCLYGSLSALAPSQRRQIATLILESHFDCEKFMGWYDSDEEQEENRKAWVLAVAKGLQYWFVSYKLQSIETERDDDGFEDWRAKFKVTGPEKM
jgi:hypothetical protein